MVNFDDFFGFEFFNFGLECIVKVFECREEGVFKFEYSSNVYDGGEGVVG